MSQLVVAGNGSGFPIPYLWPAAQIDRNNLEAMRGWNVGLAKQADAAPQQNNLFVVGDSIWEGWSGTNNDTSQAFRVLETQLALAYNGGSGRHGDWAPASSGLYPIRFSAAGGTSTERLVGLSLRGLNMNAGDPAVTATAICDRIVVQYRERNLAASAGIRIRLDGAIVFDSGETFKNNAPFCDVAFGQRVVTWDSGVLPRQSRTLSIEQLTVGPFNGGMLFDGARFFDGDFAAPVLCWNCSHFGLQWGDYAPDSVTNQDWLSVVRQGLIRPSAFLWCLGTNNGTDTATLTAQIRTTIAGANAAAVAGGFKPPAHLALIPAETGTKTEAQWDRMRDVWYRLQDSLNLAVYDWGELTGGVGDAYDTYDLAADGVHPGPTGQRMIGTFATAGILQATSPTAAALGVANAAKLTGVQAQQLAASAAAPLATVVNVAVATQLFSTAIAAAEIGDVFHIVAWGDHLNTTGSNKTFAFRPLLGGVALSIAANTPAQATSATRGRWRLEVTLEVAQIGAAAPNVHALATMRTVGTGTTGFFAPNVQDSNEELAVDLTAGANLTFEITPSAADALLDFRLRGLSVERERNRQS